MARSKNGYKQYQPGDPIHIVVTQEFVDDANDFFTYCRERGFNPSQVIRQAMVEWMKNQRTMDDIPIAREASDPMDEKLLSLMRNGGRERERRRCRLNPRSAIDILDRT